jgi:hypothetical protein
VPGVERLAGIRVVAEPAALDAARFEGAVAVLRIAADEAYAVGASGVELDDASAIVTVEASLSGIWLAVRDAESWLERECSWELPTERPAFAQGMVAGIATKLWLEHDRVLVVFPATMAADAEERLA